MAPFLGCLRDETACFASGIRDQPWPCIATHETPKPAAAHLRNPFMFFFSCMALDPCQFTFAMFCISSLFPEFSTPFPPALFWPTRAFLPGRRRALASGRAAARSRLCSNARGAGCRASRASAARTSTTSWRSSWRPGLRIEQIERRLRGRTGAVGWTGAGVGRTDGPSALGWTKKVGSLWGGCGRLRFKRERRTMRRDLCKL